MIKTTLIEIDRSYPKIFFYINFGFDLWNKLKTIYHRTLSVSIKKNLQLQIGLSRSKKTFEQISNVFRKIYHIYNNVNNRMYNNNEKIVINFAKSLPLSPFESCSLTGSRLSFMRWQSSRRNAARCFRKWIAWAQVVCPPGLLLPVVRAHPESNYGRMSKFRPRSYLTPRLVFASFTIFLLFSLEAAPPPRFRFLFPRRE